MPAEAEAVHMLWLLYLQMALLWDKGFKKWVDTYAKDEELFFKVGGWSHRARLCTIPGHGCCTTLH